jgi:DNA repair exonuclease SbcCD ATPase subunit
MNTENAPKEADAILTLAGQLHEKAVRADQDLREAHELLGNLLADLRTFYPAAGNLGGIEVETLHSEIERLNQLLQERDPQLDGTNQPTDEESSEVAILRRQVQEQDALIEKLRAEGEKVPLSREEMDAADYEAELNEFRRQLETDRKALNEEVVQLRTRNTELNEVAREAELELSRERAQLARERAQLNRLREEVRQELEVAERHASVQEQLAPVQRLKDELNERNRRSRPSATQTTAQQEASNAARWRNLLNGSGDGE